LARSRIRGVTTNRDFLVATLRHPEFLAGRATTSFIERAGVALARTPSADELRSAGIAASLDALAAARRAAPVLRGLPAGWRNSVMPPETRRYDYGAESVEVTYRAQRDGSFRFGDDVVRLHEVRDGWVDFEAGGTRHRVHVLGDDHRIWVQGPDGDVALTTRPRFPEAEREAIVGGLVAPMPGKIVSVEVAVGDSVSEGQLLMIVEAMKMEHRIVAPHAGMVGDVRAHAGDQVAGGDLLVVLGEAMDA
jgi:propionyl-CoA carboxylase alpha chain